MQQYEIKDYFSGRCSSFGGLAKIFRFFGGDIAFFVFEDIILDTTNGLLYEINGRPVREVADQYIFWRPYCIWKDIKKKEIDWRSASGKNQITTIAQQRFEQLENLDLANIGALDYFSKEKIYVSLLAPQKSYPFGHFHDYLQKALLFTEYKNELPSEIRESVIQYIISSTEQINNFYLHSAPFGLNLYNSIENKLLPQFVKVERLAVPVCPVYTTKYSKFIYEKYLLKPMLELANDCESNEIASTTRGKKKLRLYLTRNHVKPGIRGVIGEDYLIKKLIEDFGFVVVTGNESLACLISIFSNADVVAGPHGSLFINTIYCRRDAKIFEFCCSNRLDVSFKQRIKRCVNYTHITVDCDGKFNMQADLILRLLNETQ